MAASGGWIVTGTNMSIRVCRQTGESRMFEIGVIETDTDGCIRGVDYNRNQYEYICVGRLVYLGWCDGCHWGRYGWLRNFAGLKQGIYRCFDRMIQYDSPMACNSVIFFLQSAHVGYVRSQWNYCHGELFATACCLCMWVSFTRWWLNARKRLLAFSPITTRWTRLWIDIKNRYINDVNRCCKQIGSRPW